MITKKINQHNRKEIRKRSTRIDKLHCNNRIFKKRKKNKHIYIFNVDHIWNSVHGVRTMGYTRMTSARKEIDMCNMPKEKRNQLRKINQIFGVMFFFLKRKDRSNNRTYCSNEKSHSKNWKRKKKKQLWGNTEFHSK